MPNIKNILMLPRRRIPCYFRRFFALVTSAFFVNATSLPVELTYFVKDTQDDSSKKKLRENLCLNQF